MKRLLTGGFALLMAAASQAQLQEGSKNINNLCGCFDVEFQYAETFAPDASYKYHDREHMGALELALPIIKTDKKIVIQHLLVIDSNMIIKHWREEWEYESPVLWKYTGDKTWTKEELKPEQYKGKWTQTIWEVDDAPRYQGVGEWVKTDNKIFWQNTTDAPLPRREYSVRSDYNILKRGNRIIITPTGWLHEQDNEKIIKKGSQETLLVKEKGYNDYKLTDKSKCTSAITWWNQQAGFWTIVRTEWDNLLRRTTTITLQSKVEGKRLDEHFAELYKKWSSKTLTASELSTAVAKVLNSFTASQSSVARSGL